MFNPGPYTLTLADSNFRSYLLENRGSQRLVDGNAEVSTRNTKVDREQPVEKHWTTTRNPKIVNPKQRNISDEENSKQMEPDGFEIDLK
jgi:hypothetical protein